MKQPPWGKRRLPPPAVSRAAQDVPGCAGQRQSWAQGTFPPSAPLRCDLPVTPHHRRTAGLQEETVADKLSGM